MDKPKSGEWWWCQILATGYSASTEAMKHENPVQGSIGELCQWHSRIGWLPDRLVRPIARIPDPPAPEPTEAEKIDARRAEIIKLWFRQHGCGDLQELSRMIRASDEAAGYVLAPTSGPGVEAMFKAARAAYHRTYTTSDGPIRGALRAALESLKGEGR